MKKLIVILLVVEFCAAYFIVSPTCILRRDQIRAYAAWRDHPTLEKQAELDRQKRITEWQNVGVSTIIFGGMTGITLLLACNYRKKRVLP